MFEDILIIPNIQGPEPQLRGLSTPVIQRNTTTLIIKICMNWSSFLCREVHWLKQWIAVLAKKKKKSYHLYTDMAIKNIIEKVKWGCSLGHIKYFHLNFELVRLFSVWICPLICEQQTLPKVQKVKNVYID